MSRYRPTATEFLYSDSDPALEREFFSRVMLPNGTVKTTTEHRLDDLNELALPLVSQLPQPIKVMDVGASSGVSTAEWLEQLSAHGIHCEITGTDLTINAWHVKPHSWLEALVDDQERPIHLSIGGRGMPPKANFPTGIIPWAATKYLRLKMSMGVRKQEVALVSKRANGIRFSPDDLTRPSTFSGLNVIRAANILNLGYFPQDVLRLMIANIKSRLADGGLLILCRTIGTTNHGTIHKFSGRFSPLAKIGDGSEIDHLIAESNSLEYRPPSADLAPAG
jgi:chemotaxis methyl-accepting protein methylase